MRNFRDLSIRSKLRVLSVVASMTALLLACLAFAGYDRITFRDSLIRKLSSQARMVGLSSSSALIFNDPKAGADSLSAFRVEPNILAAGIYANDGQLFARYVRDSVGPLRCDPHLAVGEEEGHRIEGNRLVLYRWIQSESGDPVGVVCIQSDLHEMNARLQQYGGIAAIVLSLSLLVGFGASARLQTIIAEPILHLEGVTQRVTEEQDYSIRAASRNRDETGRLIESFNHMLSQVQERDSALRHEIAERKQAEIELRESQEQFLQVQKMEAIGRLAGGVAHDFNNQIFVVNGYCELLLAEIADDHPFAASIHEIQRAAQRSSELTGQLLAFSRRQILQPRLIYLNSELLDLEKMLKRLIGEDIELRFLVQNNVRSVKVDPGQLHQVVMNLAINARDAMPRGGKLTIETSLVELDEAYAQSRVDVTPGLYVQLSVSDTGQGMTPEVLHRIFEPFFTTKPSGQGTGLGLSTVHGIVKQSGGHITVYSEVGRGTTFRVYLAHVDENPDTLSVPLPQEIRGGSETILLAEDEGSVRDLVRRVLRERGYQVLVAANGKEAYEFASRFDGPIHLLVTDVVMPEMNGAELSERLRISHPETQVLFMSGYTENVLGHHGVLEAGLVFLPKPCPTETLLLTIRRVLDARPHSSLADSPYARQISG